MAATTDKPKYGDVFKAHPTTKVIFVVDGQPFLEEAQAKNFARGTKQEVETIERPSDADLKKSEEVK
jgi:hypothetical protein